jgi:hypothetical protein
MFSGVFPGLIVPGYSIMGSYVSGNTEVSSSRDAYPDPGGAYRNRRVRALRIPVPALAALFVLVAKKEGESDDDDHPQEGMQKNCGGTTTTLNAQTRGRLYTGPDNKVQISTTTTKEKDTGRTGIEWSPLLSEGVLNRR